MSPASGDTWPDIELHLPVELSCLPCRGHKVLP
jgi:hypothetical protein